MLMFLAACERPAGDAGAAPPAASGAALEKGAIGERILARPVQRARRMARASGEHRAVLLVVPGDASVTVDGQPARRTDGVVELVGKVGKTWEVRVFKGEKHIDKTVTLEKSGASPAFLDLNAPAPPPPGARRAATPKQRDPDRFDQYEEPGEQAETTPSPSTRPNRNPSSTTKDHHPH
ncbi:hypothetical protein WME73_10630 [Sorangium sp. So ce302]